jgi:2-deoxy-D-gluconate 3-dehydrogenase
MDGSISELLSLDGRSALVTGGATGIGEGIARVLHAAGAHVTIADIDVVGATRVAESIGGEAIHLDVTDPESAAAGVASLGGIDVLVNNAGSYHEAGSILDQSPQSWQRSIAINLASVFNCAKPFAKRLVAEGKGGAIVNVASVDGLLPCLGSGYDSAKAGVIHMTRSLALDLAPHGIRVNAIAPGYVLVDTLEKMHRGEIEPLWPNPSSLTGLMGPMMKQRSSNIPLGRGGTPEEMGYAVLFLCSPLSRYVIGQTIGVDGGWTLV